MNLSTIPVPPQPPISTSLDTIADCSLVGCPQCDSINRAAVSRFADPDQPWQVVRCVNCDTMYTFPQPLSSQWENYYLEDYQGYQVKNKTGTTSAKPGYLTSRWRRWRESYWKTPFGNGQLLDVGCGSGKYLARMRALGWNVLGLDRSTVAATTARKHFGIPVLIGSLPHQDLTPGRFDLITCWQTLEHLENPRSALAAIHALLQPQGRLLLTVPNQNGWAARFFGADWIGLDLPRHLTHFTATSLAKMVTEQGLVVRQLRTIGQSGWLRHSARRARVSGQPWTRQCFTSSFWSRWASALATTCGQGESFWLEAKPG